VFVYAGLNTRGIAPVWRKIMKQLGLGIIVAVGLTLPAIAQETERAQLAEGIYVLNVAKSTALRGILPPAQFVKVEKDKSTVVGWNAAGEVINFTLPFPPPDGKPRPITGSSVWDTIVTTQLDPFTFSEVRSKDGKPVTTTFTMINPKGNMFMTTLVGRINSILFVYEKQ
jgi:hypothetical protein